jgi:hypothetical protein
MMLLLFTELPAFAESRQLQLADECGKGTSAGFAEAGALVPPTSVGAAPPVTWIHGFPNKGSNHTYNIWSISVALKIIIFRLMTNVGLTKFPAIISSI